MSDFTGKDEKIPCEHSYILINEIEAFKTLIFDAAEVRTMKALVKDHESLTVRLERAERERDIYKRAVEQATFYCEGHAEPGYECALCLIQDIAQAAIREAESLK